MTPLAIVGAALIALAGVLHVYIFTLESVSWARPATWKRFGVRSQSEADVLKSMAYNQGWYNLFLAVGTIGGSVLAFAGQPTIGLAIAVFAAASMVAAAIVLVTSNPKLVRAAVLQGTLPLLGSVLILLALVTLGS